MSFHQVPDGRAAGAALAGQGPGLGRRVGHTGSELQLQFHVLAQLGRKMQTFTQTQVGLGLQLPCAQPSRLPKAFPLQKLGNPDCPTQHWAHLKETRPQSLEGHTEGKRTALPGEAKVIEGCVADDGVKGCLHGPALLFTQLLSWGQKQVPVNTRQLSSAPTGLYQQGGV